jgi:acetoin utilization deacetylase AcuC-like enzyme
LSYPTALVLHPDCGRHDTGWGHPEHQGRLPAIVHALYRDTPALLERVLQREGSPASFRALNRVHTLNHIGRIRTLAEDAARGGTLSRVEADTMVSAASYDAAVAAAGCLLDAVGLVMRGEAQTAFALSRPPGHHATPERAMGFCLFNNVAVAARALCQEHGLKRVLIVDWDVHHGNGTQEAFWADGNVYYVSLHQSPLYPGTGDTAERGVGAGEGRTLNVPVAAGTARVEYRRLFRAAMEQVFGEFDPEFVLVSAGFDCLAGDPLGGLLLEPEDLHGMTLELMDLSAGGAAAGRIACVLEGGYQPQRTAQGVLAVFHALAELPPL